MKTTISIDVEEELLNQAEYYAHQYRLSLSELVELYFKGLAHKASGKNVIQLIKALDKPVIDESMDLKKSYCKDQKAKYGF